MKRARRPSGDSKLKRRHFVTYFLGGSLLGTLVAFLYPVVSFLFPPRQVEASVGQVTAGKVGELAPNSFKIFKFGRSPGILILTPEGKMKAFSAVCTHLACTVRYDSETQTIHCPCHNGRFDLSGRVLSGPPPSPLEEYGVRITQEAIFVAKRSEQS
ncbi:MAG: ubiquinol-cytochrome c reductase iron-sulfur subunit [Candidatus Aminicenantales bacterium]